MKKTSDIGNKSQVERLKDILKSFGINSQEELDGALAGALEQILAPLDQLIHQTSEILRPERASQLFRRS